MGDRPPILGYEKSQRPPRWPWVVIGLIAVASSAAYACYFAGLLSFDSMVVTIEIVTFGVIFITAIIAGIKFGTQREWWA